MSTNARRATAAAVLATAAACATPAAAGAASGTGAAAPAGPAAAVSLEDLTSPELRQRIAAGTGTVLLPIGGTEQGGPHLALGKHNRRVRVLAERIAQRLGDAVVAPVLAYVPEGAVAVPTEHMRWAGTISVPAGAFEAVLEGAALSLRRHGLCHVVLVGDHGGYRASLDRVAARLDRPAGCRALALPEYYRAATADQPRTLQAAGHAGAAVGGHGGLADTALTLALDPGSVRTAALAAAAGTPGVAGDPAQASAELGRAGAEHLVAASVAATAGRRNDSFPRSVPR